MHLSHRRARRRASVVLGAILAVVLAVAPAALADSGSATRFIRSAVVNPDHTATLPLLRGTSGGQPVWYVVLDASTSTAAATYGANRSNKLANARGTSAVQKVGVHGGVIDFPATVDFGRCRSGCGSGSASWSWPSGDLRLAVEGTACDVLGRVPISAPPTTLRP